MGSLEASLLADFARAVRESSLRRFRVVPRGRENWRPTPMALTIADLARHLIAADRWLFEKLEHPDFPPMTAETGVAPLPDRSAYDALLNELEVTGHLRADHLKDFTPADLAAPIPDVRFGGEVSTWWVVVRGNLDHEIHHRGQLAAYLGILQAGSRDARE